MTLLTQSAELDAPVSTLKGVGPKLCQTLKKCHITTLSDLIFYLPYRYQDRTRITPICDLKDSQFAVIQGMIIKTHVIFHKRRQLICYIQDGQGILKIRFFYFNKGIEERLESGLELRAFGQVRLIKNHFEMAHPELSFIDNDKPTLIEDKLTPIYSVTTGLSQAKIRQLISLALNETKENTYDILTPKELDGYAQYNLHQTLSYLHFPPPDCNQELLEEKQHPLQLRLALEELTTHYLSILMLRKKRETLNAYSAPVDFTSKKQLIASLPFSLTDAQCRVISEIETDLAKPYPMYRLVQGDVGSGKTLVAAISSLPILKQGLQVALMAPTEILAKQHAKNFSLWLQPLGFTISLLTGKQKQKEKNLILRKIEQGEAHLIIGTHALFQEKIIFSQLGLVIIDEQHRFGVAQRLTLKNKGKDKHTLPHELVMTATPIPRSLAQTKLAFLDISSIDELPNGRKPIETTVIANSKRAQVISKLDTALSNQQQAYWVCTLIDESLNLECENATKTYLSLKTLLPKHRVGLIHGRLKGEEKGAIMLDFKDHKIDLLVATTVIEVGVDVPNASIMVIENAERFGLAQLHQLRGRVGRGERQSYCLLLYQSPLSAEGTFRLNTMRDTTSGFEIAEADLKLRGQGEFLGVKQTGFSGLKVANTLLHKQLITRSKALAKNIISNRQRTNALIQRWLGIKQNYWQS